MKNKELPKEPSISFILDDEEIENDIYTAPSEKDKKKDKNAIKKAEDDNPSLD